MFESKRFANMDRALLRFKLFFLFSTSISRFASAFFGKRACRALLIGEWKG